MGLIVITLVLLLVLVWCAKQYRFGEGREVKLGKTSEY
jgi:hypothetical protein